MSSQSKLTATVGIPTCYGGESLVETIRSIRNAMLGDTIRLLVVADRTPLTPSVREELMALNVELTWNETEGSQLKKVRQIIEKTTSDILIITQDDITFMPDTISEIMREFSEHPEATVVGTRILPLSPRTCFEHATALMVRSVDRIAGRWNRGNNYLAASGRCLSFRTTHLKKFRMLEGVVNGDMFQYLENIRLGGVFVRARRSVVHIRAPQRFADQLGPSSRFQYSAYELQQYFDFPIQSYYHIPVLALINALMCEFITHPVALLQYLGVYVLSRIRRRPPAMVLKTLWAIDTSTKKTSL